MSRRPWYKRYPSDFIAGTIGLTAEEKGVYSTILDLLYDRGCPIIDDPRELGRICGCSTLRFKQVRDKLAGLQKIVLREGKITNPRFENQQKNEEKEHEKFEESGRKGAEKTNGFKTEPSENNDLFENRPPSQNPAYQKPEARSQKESPTLEFQEEFSGSAPDKSPGAGPPDPELSGEEEFWSLADTAQKRGIARSRLGQLVKLSGNFAVALPALKSALRTRDPGAYLGKVISNLRADLGPNVSRIRPRADEPDFVQRFRADGYPIEKRTDGHWRIAGSIYDGAGEVVGW